MWTVKEETITDKKKDIITHELSLLYSSDDYNDRMSTCETERGKLVEISVPAGLYKTCYTKRIDRDGDESIQRWWGDVPFGLVKSVKTDMDNDAVTTLELVSLTLGQK